MDPMSHLIGAEFGFALIRVRAREDNGADDLSVFGPRPHVYTTKHGLSFCCPLRLTRCLDKPKLLARICYIPVAEHILSHLDGFDTGEYELREGPSDIDAWKAGGDTRIVIHT